MVNILTILWRCILITVFLFLNSSLNLLNSWALRVYQFRFPLVLTACHMLFCFVALAPVMLTKQFRSSHVATLKQQWKGLVGIGMFVAVNVALNNISLVYITLALNQIIRSGMPVVTAAIAVVVEKKIPTSFEVSALIVLTIGVSLAVCTGHVGGTVMGICFCCAALVSNAAMTCFSAKALSEKMDALRLTFYTAPVSLLFLAPFAYVLEWEQLLIFWREHSEPVVYILAVTSVVALTYNIVHYLMIQATSSTTTTVVGMIKVVALVVFGAVLLPGEKNVFTPRFVTGAFITFVGFGMYTYTRLPAFKRLYSANINLKGSKPSNAKLSEIEAPLVKASSEAV